MTLSLAHRGKVRDVYDAGDGRLLMLTSDRMSAFDVVMAEPIPDKGRVLTAMTAYWLDHVADVVPSHLISTDVADLPPEAADLGDDLAGRVMLVRRAEMLPIECIVRGYVAGSAWKEYRQEGTVHGMAVPSGLREADRLPEPLFTPSTKAEIGQHDENITPDEAAKLVGDDVFEAARSISLAVYHRAAEQAAERGIIVADTKFELGWIEGRLCLCDEVLTPDSSRFWSTDTWQPGSTPPSFDKQPLRDWLEASGWDKRPPPPPLPPDVVEATADRYRSAYERVTGRSLADWPGARSSRRSTP
jgi:phosphoribosylaminoimidazole-succinocarboxamide synthase